MPYLGRAPTGTGSVTEIDGDLKITGQLTAQDTLFKMILDGTDGSSTNASDNIIIEDGGTDGSGTDAGDDICTEKDTGNKVGGENILGTLSSGIAAGNLTGIPRDGWEFISTITASNASDIVFESMTTGYDWSFVGSNMIAKTDTQLFNTLVGIAGPTYRTSSYLGHTFDMAAGGANGSDKTSQFGTHRTNQGTGSNEQFGFQAFLIDPANASTKTNFQSFGGCHNAGSYLTVDIGFGYYTTAEAHTCVKFVMASGNIDGKVDVYRRPNA